MPDDYTTSPDTDLLPPVDQYPPYDGPLFTLPIYPIVPDGDHPLEPPEVSSDSLNNWELDGIETFALSPITPSDATGLKKALLEVIGSYDNVVTQYRYMQDGSTRYTYVNEITPDYPWIFSAILFIVLIASIFRIFRSVLWKQ